MPDETAPTVQDPRPYPDEVLLAPPRRSVVEPPVYRGRRVKAFSARCAILIRYWSVYRSILALFCVFAFGLIGVAAADAFFCPEGAGVTFWEGCLWETVGLGSGGGLLGFAFFLLAVQAFSTRPSPRPDSTTDAQAP